MKLPAHVNKEDFFLFYVMELYASEIRNDYLYGEKRVFLDSPRFLIFYNGQQEQPERKELKLSEAFRIREEEPALELRVILLNINKGKNHQLMEACRTLRDYAEYTDLVRKYAKEMELEEAVERAITECIRRGILEDFLRKNRAEAKRMSIFEYDEERHLRMLSKENRELGREEGLVEGLEKGRTEGLEEGRKEGLAMGKVDGKIEGILALLSLKGPVPEALQKRLWAVRDEEILLNYLKIAASAKSVEEFEAALPE